MTIRLQAPPPASSDGFQLGSARAPDGTVLGLDNRSLLLNGERWTPAMGEFHYARYPAAEWRDELLKLKAGGIDIVATYVFWIHHEEKEGQWDWSGDRDLHQFVATAGEVGLKVIVRAGPWCHGEVRNGGLPDWIVARGKARTSDPAYLKSVSLLDAQIAAQLRGLLWKDGGPVIGLQLENEFHGPASHLLDLKRLAREAGLDVPYYTRTGWPELSTPMPFGEVLPLYGVYAEGFWDRELVSMPGKYWAGFHFSTQRTDANIANEALGHRDARDAADLARYPYLTCEIGGGMMSAYHRRILVDPRDIEATTLVKLGSGSSSPGYYMYHGGTNPDGRLTTLMEDQSTPLTNWNDMPVKNYDFQSPLGQYGQVREQYHRLRRLHYFLRDCGSDLAGMGVALPGQRPAGKDDLTTLRWSMRSDGRRGFIFVNNHERGRELPTKSGVQFAVTLANGEVLRVPSRPATISSEAMFIWPVNLDLKGTTLIYATAQPVTHLNEDERVRTLFFAESPGAPAEFCFEENELKLGRTDGEVRHEGPRIIISGLRPSRGPAIEITANSGRQIRIVLLSQADSFALWKGSWQGRNRIFLTDANLAFDHGVMKATGGQSLACYPLDHGDADGIFRKIPLAESRSHVVPAQIELLRKAGPPRTIALGQSPHPVAAAPRDADFAQAAEWKIVLPANLNLKANPTLRLNYVGDVARVKIDGRLITDDFYNGAVLEVGLGRHAADLAKGELRVEILPLRADAPIYFSSLAAKPDFAGREAVAELRSAELAIESVTTLN